MNKNNDLASYAVSEYNSRGRQYPVVLAKDRNAFQRDYTRLVHSRSFRKLHGKTQVFPAEMGEMHDTYRTRMSHSIEVEQVARSIARALRVNEDLCGALAVGHDIGHAPFGHLGQDVLNDLFKDIGGFEHNYQALKIVDQLESPYPDYKGLNLMFETREGLLKHCNRQRAIALGTVAERHLNASSPPLEVQIVDAADQIAYLHGDLEDAFDKGLFDGIDLNDIPGFKNCWEEISKENPHLSFPSNQALLSQDPHIRQQMTAIIGEVWRKMLSNSVNSLIIHSRSNIELCGIETLSDVRLSSPLITLPPAGAELNRAIRSYSRKNIYNHPRVTHYLKTAEEAFRTLYEKAMENPEHFSLSAQCSREEMRDWMAGLTDRAVLSWYSNMYDPNLAQQLSIQTSLK